MQGSVIRNLNEEKKYKNMEVRHTAFKCSARDAAPDPDEPEADFGLSWTLQGGGFDDNLLEEYQRCNPIEGVGYAGVCFVRPEQIAAIDADPITTPEGQELRLRPQPLEGHRFSGFHHLTRCPNDEQKRALAKFANENGGIRPILSFEKTE